MHRQCKQCSEVGLGCEDANDGTCTGFKQRTVHPDEPHLSELTKFLNDNSDEDWNVGWAGASPSRTAIRVIEYLVAERQHLGVEPIKDNAKTALQLFVNCPPGSRTDEQARAVVEAFSDLTWFLARLQIDEAKKREAT